MLKRPLVCSLAMVGILATSVWAAESKLEDHPYFPLKVGSTWVHKVKVSPTSTIEVTTTVKKHERIGAVLTARLESSIEGKVVQSENLANEDEGLFRYAQNGANADPPILVLKSPTAKGDKWDIDSKVKGEAIKGSVVCDEEEIEIGKDKHKAIVSTLNVKLNDAGKMTAITWFGKGVGMLKQNVIINKAPLELELDKFTPAK